MIACAEPACPQPATYRGRCPNHARTHDRNTNRAGYHIYRTKRWQIVRNHHLFHHPLCDHCGQIATQVHHRQDLEQGGQPWAPDNLQSLCGPCHARITRQRQSA
jgi:5-methylcytosine-specific restriction protein A